LLFLVEREVVEHEGREHAVERRVRVRQLARETTIELHCEPLLLRLSPCARERLGVGIQAYDLGARMETFDEEGQVAVPAADVEDVVHRLDVRLIDELSVRRLTADQLGEHVVQREQPVVTGRRNERPVSLASCSAHGYFLSGNYAYMNPRTLASQC